MGRKIILLYFCVIFFRMQAEFVQCQYSINDNAVCYNVHKVTIQDSEIHGDINFEGITGLLEKNLNSDKN